jgi:hypothetical protein
MLCATRCAEWRSAEASTMRALDVLARPVAVGRDRRQLLALRAAQHHTDLLCHGPIPARHASIAYPDEVVNLLN